MATLKRKGRPKQARWIWLSGVAILLAVVGLVAYRATAQRGGAVVKQFMHLHGLAVDPSAPDHVFVATHQGLLRIGPDDEWVMVSKVRNDYMGFQPNPTAEGVLYSSGHPAPGVNLPNPVGFMVSEDSGATWSIRSLAGEVDFHVMAVQPTDGDVIYGVNSGLMRSQDGGTSWERLESPQLAGLGNIYALAVGPASADTVLLGTTSGLWRSRDAGRTWSALIPNTPVTAVTFGPDRIFAYAAADVGLVSSDDDGASWSGNNLLLTGQDAIAYIAPNPASEGTLTVGSFGQDIFRTTDFGQTWATLADNGLQQAR